MKYILMIAIALMLSNCKDPKKQNYKTNSIVLRSLDRNQEGEKFSIGDTMKIIHILILQEQVVKQAYVHNDNDYQYMLQVLAQNEVAYQNAYHETWITTIQRPRDPKRQKK